MPWTESPFFEKELAASTASKQEKIFLRDYARNGYAIVDTHIPHRLLDVAVETMRSTFDKIKGADKRVQDAWKYNEAVKRIATDPNIMDALALLYQRNPIPFQTLSFPEGTQQDTHSDMIHFNSIPERFMCGVWVALEDITDFNGPLHYYPGSHKLPFYDMIDIGVKASKNVSTKKALMVYAENYTSFIKEMIVALKLKKETLNIKKGQAIIWSANLLHGGNTILNAGSSRHSQVTHYFFEDCMYYTPRLSDVAINKVHLRDLTNIATGERVINKYFGEPVRANTKLYLEQKTIRMFNSIVHLFPDDVVQIVKKILKR
jgi:hypothetical protein